MKQTKLMILSIIILIFISACSKIDMAELERLIELKFTETHDNEDAQNMWALFDGQISNINVTRLRGKEYVGELIFTIDGNRLPVIFDVVVNPSNIDRSVVHIRDMTLMTLALAPLAGQYFREKEKMESLLGIMGRASQGWWETPIRETRRGRFGNTVNVTGGGKALLWLNNRDYLVNYIREWSGLPRGVSFFISPEVPPSNRVIFQLPSEIKDNFRWVATVNMDKSGPNDGINIRLVKM